MARQGLGEDLAHPDALAVLGRAPTPAQGRSLGISTLTAVLHRHSGEIDQLALARPPGASGPGQLSDDSAHQTRVRPRKAEENHILTEIVIVANSRHVKIPSTA